MSEESKDPCEHAMYGALSASMLAILDTAQNEMGLEIGTLLVGFLGDLILSRNVKEEALRDLVEHTIGVTNRYKASVHPGSGILSA